MSGDDFSLLEKIITSIIVIDAMINISLAKTNQAGFISPSIQKAFMKNHNQDASSENLSLFLSPSYNTNAEANVTNGNIEI